MEVMYDKSNYEREFVPGELIVGMRFSVAEPIKDARDLFPELEIAKIEDLHKSVMDVIPEDVKAAHPEKPEEIRMLYVVTLASETRESVLDAIESLKGNPLVSHAYPNYISHPAGTPNDIGYANQWNMDKIEMPQAWDIVTGSKSIDVAVMDSGVDYNHPDLAANIHRGSAYNVAEDKYGNNADIMDYDGHGTHVAGILGAVGDNNVGVAGVCWDVTMIPIKIVNSNIDPTTSIGYQVKAVQYATTYGFPISNMSYEIENVMQSFDFFAAAYDYQGLLVLSTGDTAISLNSFLMYSGLQSLTNVIIVAGSQQNDSLGANSGYGSTSVTLAAPGENVYSTLPGNSYGYSSGSSPAAPHVAGVAALLLNCKPNLTAAQLKTAIVSNVDVVPALSGLVFTSGRLNALKALKSVTFTVHGYVAPMVTSAIASSFPIVVELRQTFLTPAPQGLSTIATPVIGISGRGEFTLQNVPAGNYNLHIRRAGYIVRPMLVNISKSTGVIELAPPPGIDNGVFNLAYGDIDGDYRVDNSDIMMVSELFNFTYGDPDYDPSRDLNADEIINNDDILMILENWGMTLFSYAGSAGVDPFH
jgi:hypothetical protein